ncbi:hypothetical protein J2W32_004189 [Variovorax boronicumulans]|uniref:DUF6314 domain-containing protein n=1 Tax=Variovorax boronicumulans TaxID=436515 RepID=A0AAW8CWQ0_9BURK|nr:DUF6314 family protein [Variovorax boronicumulans]MDP9892046.1 hypothetical protein [Variovorax boronicumulans]MDQ0055131.1 hypothetical protein [Variovorax boronicumulans]
METTPLPPFAWGTPDSVFDQFEGTWDLDRTIEGKASMVGTARFRRDDAAWLKYREEGRIQLPDGQSFDGHREYVFEGITDGFSVYFAETPLRLFHEIAIVREGDELVGSAGHLCVADQYDSVYRFRTDGSFVIEHLVKGPRKDYLSRTVFKRRGA